MFKNNKGFIQVVAIMGIALALLGGAYVYNTKMNGINLSASSADLWKISSDNLAPIKSSWGIVVNTGEDVCITGGNCLSTAGTGTGGASNWQELFSNVLTPTSTTAGIFVKASSTFDSTLRVNSGLIVNSNATTTGNSLIGNTLYVKDGKVGIGTDNPNVKLEVYNSSGAGTINLSGNGSDTYNFDSITMYDTGGKYWAIHHRNTDGGLNNLLFEHYDGANYNGYMTINPDGHIITPNLRITTANATTTNVDNLVVNTGSTFPANDITDAEVSNTLTCSDLVAGSAVVADSEVVDALTLNTSVEGIFTGNIRANWLNATSSIIDSLFSTGSRIATLNATTTKIDNLTVNTEGVFTNNIRIKTMNATTTNIDDIFALRGRIGNVNATSSLFDTTKAISGTTTDSFYSSKLFSTTADFASSAFVINSSGVATSSNTTTIGNMKCFKNPNQESHTTTCLAI